MRGHKITPDVKKSIADLYCKELLSLAEVSKRLNVSPITVRNQLLNQNIKIRSVSEGTSIKWLNPLFRENQIQKRTGKPSGAKGKNWKYKEILKRPNSQGEKSHFWKGGVTKLNKQIRNLVEYKNWRFSVFSRDDFTCQHCKKTKSKYVQIHADHIVSLARIILKENIKNTNDALRCSILWDLDNGRTLCIDCHKKTDSWLNNRL